MANYHSTKIFSENSILLYFCAIYYIEMDRPSIKQVDFNYKLTEQPSSPSFLQQKPQDRLRINQLNNAQTNSYHHRYFDQDSQQLQVYSRLSGTYDQNHPPEMHQAQKGKNKIFKIQKTPKINAIQSKSKDQSCWPQWVFPDSQSISEQFKSEMQKEENELLQKDHLVQKSKKICSQSHVHHLVGLQQSQNMNNQIIELNLQEGEVISPVYHSNQNRIASRNTNVIHSSSQNSNDLQSSYSQQSEMIQQTINDRKNKAKNICTYLKKANCSEFLKDIRQFQKMYKQYLQNCQITKSRFKEYLTQRAHEKKYINLRTLRKIFKLPMERKGGQTETQLMDQVIAKYFREVFVGRENYKNVIIKSQLKSSNKKIAMAFVRKQLYSQMTSIIRVEP